MIRHLITCEYPPQPGGVSDYSELVANGLAAAGDEVHVWCPGAGAVELENRADSLSGVFAHREFGQFKPGDLRRVGKLLDQFSEPRRLLVQWVPHGYGHHSMNLAFCLWLWQRSRLKHDQIDIMVHEPFLAFGEGSIKQDVAAAAHRAMVVILLRAANRVWVSIPDWEKRLRPFAFGNDKTFGWLPVPSNIPVIADAEGVNKVRAQYASGGKSLVGHFGPYDQYTTELMLKLLPRLLTDHDQLSVLLLGKGSAELFDQLVSQQPDLSRQVGATGLLSAADLSRHIRACDVMLQPYQDGVSGRRGSVMAALSHGIPVVTTLGRTTEDCWLESEAVKLTKVGDVTGLVEATSAILNNTPERHQMGAASKEFYRRMFDLSRTVSALRNGPGS
ncbi:MAG TPA: glycosyltransferase [Pyrinomonadaceae bacterium]|nr:glycosyltransferase [Pyrinomonadaceae bacterium]